MLLSAWECTTTSIPAEILGKSLALCYTTIYKSVAQGAPAEFQARVGKHVFDKCFRLPTLPYVTVAHPAHRSTLVPTAT